MSSIWLHAVQGVPATATRILHTCSCSKQNTVDNPCWAQHPGKETDVSCNFRAESFHKPTVRACVWERNKQRQRPKICNLSFKFVAGISSTTSWSSPVQRSLSPLHQEAIRDIVSHTCDNHVCGTADCKICNISLSGSAPACPTR